MRRAAGSLAAVSLAVASACGAPPEPGQRLDPATLWGPVAVPADALTFARRDAPAGRELPLPAGGELLLVQAIAGDQVEAVVVPGADDPIALLAERGAEALWRAARDGARVRVPLAELGLPADLGSHHVAAGANFRAHGDEVGVESPFLFPKLVAPTRWTSPVPAAARLDYEVELCFVTLRPLAAAEDPSAFGVLLCNDFTERWTLAKGMLGPGEMGTRGFADAKSRPGFLPVGPFLVVPRELERFLAGVTLELWVNGTLRQRASAQDMIWTLPALVERAFAWCERGYRYAGGSVSLLPDGRSLPARTLVLSGTPGGVVFRPSNLWRGGLYLQPGDEVVARASGLGALRNRVASE